MKKISLFLVIISVLMLFFTGCNENTPNETEDGEPKYTITFIVNGETVSTATYKESDGIFDLVPFEKVGYNVLGWYDDKSETPVTKIDASLKKDITLLAIASPITYRISFNANGGTGTMSTVNLTYDHVENLPLNAFTHSQKSFIGWSLSKSGAKAFSDGDAVLNLTANENAEIVLYAMWKKSSSVVMPEI